MILYLCVLCFLAASELILHNSGSVKALLFSSPLPSRSTGQRFLISYIIYSSGNAIQVTSGP